MTFFGTPRSSTISSVDGWMVAARCSIGGSGSCSNTVMDMPLRLSASAHTIPTGPAPTMATRALALDPAMRGFLALLMLLEIKAAHDIAPYQSWADTGSTASGAAQDCVGAAGR